MDLGMCHTLSGHARVRLVPSGGYLVNGREHATEDDALDAVFKGHYQAFVQRFYKDALEGV